MSLRALGQRCGDYLSLHVLSRPYQYFRDRPWHAAIVAALWMVLEYVVLGPASYVRHSDVGDGNLGLIGSSRTLPSFGAYWSSVTVGGVDRLSQPAFVPLDTLVFAALPVWPAYALTIAC